MVIIPPFQGGDTGSILVPLKFFCQNFTVKLKVSYSDIIKVYDFFFLSLIDIENTSDNTIITGF